MPELKGSQNGGTPLIVDPTSKYFEESLEDFKEYEQSLVEASGSSDYLTEKTYEGFGDGGNPHSRSGFFPDSFDD